MGLLLNLFSKLISFIQFCIILDALLSWFSLTSINVYKYRRILSVITNPILLPIKNTLDKYIRYSPIDFSPIVAIFLLEIIRELVFIVLRFFWY